MERRTVLRTVRRPYTLHVGYRLAGFAFSTELCQSFYTGTAVNSRCWTTADFRKSGTANRWGALGDSQYLQGGKIAVEGGYFEGIFVGMMITYLSYTRIINNLSNIHGGEGVILLLQAALRKGQQLQAGLRTPIPA